MKSYNIAVCLSGEHRTFNKCAANIREFYQSDNHNVVFFGHTWTDSEFVKENNYYQTTGKEVYDPVLLHQSMNDKLPFHELLIEDKTVVDNTPVPQYIDFNDCKFGMKMAANLVKPTVYVHMSYSIMMSNWLKTKYEIENNMRFDLVVRARHDMFFHPEKKFTDYIPHRAEPTVIYGASNTFPSEYWQNHFNDVLFFGSSRVMNIVCDFYRYYSTGKFWELVDSEWADPYIKTCGYNVALYKWLTMKNIRIVDTDLLYYYTVFRKKAELLQLRKHLDQIIEHERRLFA
jgi:hypothetical protein